jgi:hypothetical protein
VYVYWMSELEREILWSFEALRTLVFNLYKSHFKFYMQIVRLQKTGFRLHVCKRDFVNWIDYNKSISKLQFNNYFEQFNDLNCWHNQFGESVRTIQLTIFYRGFILSEFVCVAAIRDMWIIVRNHSNKILRF